MTTIEVSEEYSHTVHRPLSLDAADLFAAVMFEDDTPVKMVMATPGCLYAKDLFFGPGASVEGHYDWEGWPSLGARSFLNEWAVPITTNDEGDVVFTCEADEELLKSLLLEGRAPEGREPPWCSPGPDQPQQLEPSGVSSPFPSLMHDRMELKPCRRASLPFGKIWTWTRI